MSRWAFGSPKIGTALPQYSCEEYAARFSRATCSRHSTKRGHRRHSTIRRLRLSTSSMSYIGFCRAWGTIGFDLPIYEYEPVDRDCLICDGRAEFMQSITDAPLEFCPTCGLEVRRVVSRATFKLTPNANPDKAATRGFTTYKKIEKGQWERVGGEGPDMIVGSKEDIAAVEAEAKPKRNVIDLDD